jgi:hypothetical protein
MNLQPSNYLQTTFMKSRPADEPSNLHPHICMREGSEGEPVCECEICQEKFRKGDSHGQIREKLKDPIATLP